MSEELQKSIGLAKIGSAGGYPMVIECLKYTDPELVRQQKRERRAAKKLAESAKAADTKSAKKSLRSNPKRAVRKKTAKIKSNQY